MGLGVDEGRHLLPGDLLLEDRVHDDGGGAGVLELADGVEVVDEGRGARHQGVGQLEAEVGRAEVHVFPPPYFFAVAGSASASASVTWGTVIADICL